MFTGPINDFTECAKRTAGTENSLRAQGFMNVTPRCHGWSLPYLAGEVTGEVTATKVLRPARLRLSFSSLSSDRYP